MEVDSDSFDLFCESGILISYRLISSKKLLRKMWILWKIEDDLMAASKGSVADYIAESANLANLHK